MRGTHQGQQSARAAPTGRTHDCKRPLHHTPHDLLHSGGHPHMRRRQFIAVLGGAAAWPLPAYAQQPERIRRVGVLLAAPEDFPPARANVAAFGKALADLGWVEGKNIRVDRRFAGGNPTLFKTYAAELVGLSPDVILVGTSPGLMAMREQTHTIPIVFVSVSEPVGQGFVQSLARPGGNITGFSDTDAPVMGKWLQLLQRRRTLRHAGRRDIQP
jgi:putative tryptophan/tyrosine transport system substrate-binding protein